MEDNSKGSWPRYEALVLSELKQLRESQDKLFEVVNELKLDLNTLKIKSAIWGSVAGAGIAGFVSLTVGMLLRALKF